MYGSTLSSIACVLEVTIMHDTGYLGSMGGTLYAAMGMHSYILTIVCCGAQVLTS